MRWVTVKLGWGSSRARAVGERAELDLALRADEPRQGKREGDLLRVWMRTRAKKNSFQDEMKVNRAAAITPGSSSGKTMWIRTRILLAPSTAPASSRSTRHAWTYPLQHPERERQRVDDIHDRQADQAVDQLELLEDQEQRDHDEDHREDLADQDPAQRDRTQPGLETGPARMPPGRASTTSRDVVATATRGCCTGVDQVWPGRCAALKLLSVGLAGSAARCSASSRLLFSAVDSSHSRGNPRKMK